MPTGSTKYAVEDMGIAAVVGNAYPGVGVRWFDLSIKKSSKP